MTRTPRGGHSRMMMAAESRSTAGPESELSSASLSADQRKVYGTYFSLVWRSLRRLGVRESLLEDALQDVFLIVYRRWADFEGRSSFRTWVYGIVLRVAKDYRRTEMRHSLRIERLASLQGVQSVDDFGPAEAAERREASLLLHAALAVLADDQREVFVLIELEELSVREAATAVGIRVRTCQRRLRAARAAFDSALTRCAETPGG